MDKDILIIKKDSINKSKQIEELQEKNSCVLLEEQGNIDIYNKAKYQCFCMVQDTNLYIKENDFIETILTFNSYSPHVVKIYDYFGELIKTIDTVANKSYSVVINKMSPFFPVEITVNEMNYKGVIDTQDLIMWVNGADYSLVKASATATNMTEHLDRMGKQTYLGGAKDSGYGGRKLINLTPQKWNCGAEKNFVAYYIKLGTNFSTNGVLLDYGTSLAEFNGEEFTIAMTYLSAYPNSSMSETYLFYLGDEVGESFLSAKSGREGYVHVKEDNVFVTAAKTGMPYYQKVNLVVTYSKSSGKCIVYMNGVKQVEIPVTKTLSNKLIIAGSLETTATTDNPYVGYCLLQDFRVYNRVFSKEEVLKNEKVMSINDSIIY